MIVAVHAEPATGHEADSLAIIIDRSKWLRHRVQEIVADAGYASDAVYTDLAKRRIMAFIPPQPNILKRAGGQAARKRCKTPRGVGAAIDRITHGEGAIAELKRHGADRARCRGTAKLQIQLLLAATAINLKRLTTHPLAAENAGASDNTAARARTSRSSTPAYAPRRHRRDYFYDRLLISSTSSLVEACPRRARASPAANIASTHRLAPPAPGPSRAVRRGAPAFRAVAGGHPGAGDALGSAEPASAQR